MKVPVFINIFRFEDGNFERIKSKYKDYILEESELSEYLKTYPSCCSIAPDEDYKRKKDFIKNMVWKCLEEKINLCLHI